MISFSFTDMTNMIIDLDDEDNIYASKKKFFCYRCGKSYTLNKNLKRHLTYECLTSPRYNCQFCRKKFKYQFLLRKHYEKCNFNSRNKHFNYF